MSTVPMSLPYATTNTPSRTLRLFARETGFELLRAARNRAFVLSILGFPALFYLLFGVVNKGQHFPDGAGVAKYLLGGYAAFGMVGAALFGVGVSLALERASGWLELKRASPMPPLAYLFARCLMAIAFSLVILALLCGLGIAFAGVHLTALEFARMALIAAFGVIPFAALGLLLATLLPANAAPGIANMLYLPMSYCSGLWIPVSQLPHWLQRVAPWLPSYHLAQLMLHALGYTPAGDSLLQHSLALGGFTALFLTAAAITFRRAEDAA